MEMEKLSTVTKINIRGYLKQAWDVGKEFINSGMEISMWDSLRMIRCKEKDDTCGHN